MQPRIGPRGLLALHGAVANSLALAVYLTLPCRSTAALQSGTYETVAGSTVLERGDNVPNGSRIVPRSATLTFDLAAAQPALTAVIHDAVLEGGGPYADLWLGGLQQPFELTVHSSSAEELDDGSYRFQGDYLQTLRPSGTQYVFDWKFSPASEGNIMWNGQTYWAGGHIWTETIADISLVPEPGPLVLFAAGMGVFQAFHRRHKPIPAPGPENRSDVLSVSLSCHVVAHG